MRLQFGAGGTAATGITPPGIESAPTANRSQSRSELSAGTDRITLSATSSILNRFDVSRAARIEHLSAAVAAGTYQIPSLDLSRRIVESTLGQ